MALDPKAILADIDAGLAEYAAMRKASKHDDCSDHGEVAVTAMNTRLATIIERYAEPSSRFAQSIRGTMGSPSVAGHLAPLAGVLHALRDDIAAGRLTTVAELIHGEMFGDFLEMAEHLLSEGYKDAAAVLAGGVLEGHLRKLCAKHSIAVAEANGAPRKADALNAELAKAQAYSKLDQKNVTAWAGLRNHAAHGNYGAYTADQVALLVQSIRDFVTRVPA